MNQQLLSSLERLVNHLGPTFYENQGSVFFDLYFNIENNSQLYSRHISYSLSYPIELEISGAVCRLHIANCKYKDRIAASEIRKLKDLFLIEANNPGNIINEQVPVKTTCGTDADKTQTVTLCEFGSLVLNPPLILYREA